MPFDVAGKIGSVRLGDRDYDHLSASPDGNCLFHSVGFLLERNGGPLADANRDQMWLRQQATAWIVDQVTNHAESDFGVLLALALQLRNTTALLYRTLMNTDKEWGDELCVYALENALNVRIQVYQISGDGVVNTANFPSLESDTVLRLVQPPTARAGYFNHYDPLVYQATQLEVEVRRVESVQPPHEPWKGWLKTNGRILWAPPILHTQFPSHLAPEVGLFRSIFSSIGSNNSVDIVTPKVELIHFINGKGTKGEVRSPDFANVDKKTLDVAFRVPFHLPLAMVEDEKAKKAWLKRQKKEQSQVEKESEDDDLQIDESIDNSLDIKSDKKEDKDDKKGDKDDGAGGFLIAQEAVDLAPVKLRLVGTNFDNGTNIYFRLYKKVSGAPIGGAWSMTYGNVAKLKGADVQTKARGNKKLDVDVTVDASLVIDDDRAAELCWEDSPYQLLASASQVHDDGAAAWTYFHVPSAWDVNTLQAVGKEKAVFLGDLLDPIKKLVGKPPKKPDDLGFTKKQDTEVAKMLQSLGLNYNVNTHSILYGPDNGPYQILSSWASTVVLSRAANNLSYHLQSFLYQSPDRGIYRFDPDTHAEAVNAVAKLNKELSAQNTLLTSYRMAVADYERKLEAKGKLGPATLDGINRTWRAIQDSEPTLALLDTEKIAGIFRKYEVRPRFDLNTNADTKNIIAALREVYDELTKTMNGSSADLKKLLNLPPTLRLEGVGDFACKEPFFGWLQFVAPVNQRVSKAITGGISSCAGGVTYSMTKEGNPDVMIMWHIDGSCTIPVRHLILQLWPDLAKCPALRTIAYIYPTASELDKYRKDNLYPEEIQDRCDTVFLIRGTHVYDSEFVVSCGSDFFGVDVSDPDNVAIVFSHDINPHRLGSLKGATDGDLPGLVLDVQDLVYGDYDFLNKQKPDKSNLTTLRNSLRDNEAVVRPKMNGEMIKASLTCRLPITNAVFDDLAKRGTVAGLAGFFCGDKSDQILGKSSLEKVEKNRFTPGLVRKPKVEKDKVEKKVVKDDIKE
jgi:hypothetical protein